MHISLTLTTSSSVGMVTGVHGKTTDRGANVEPAGSSSLSELAMLPGGVADDADGCGSILLDTAHLARLETNDNTVGALVARNDGAHLAEHGVRVVVRAAEDVADVAVLPREQVREPARELGPEVANVGKRRRAAEQLDVQRLREADGQRDAVVDGEAHREPDELKLLGRLERAGDGG